MEQGGDGGMLMSLLPFALIFVIMYFLILWPQQKRVKQHQEMVSNVRRGDTVITNGWLIGNATKVIDDDQIEIEIADDVRIRQMRQMVTDVRAKGEPVKEEADGSTRGLGLFKPQVGTLCLISRGGRQGRLFSRHSSSACLAFRLSRPRKWFKVAETGERHVVLGLDLQGAGHSPRSRQKRGTQEKLETLRDDVLRAARRARLRGLARSRAGASCEGGNFDQALEKLRELSQPLGGILGSSTGQRQPRCDDRGRYECG